MGKQKEKSKDYYVLKESMVQAINTTTEEVTKMRELVRKMDIAANSRWSKAYDEGKEWGREIGGADKTLTNIINLVVGFLLGLAVASVAAGFYAKTAEGQSVESVTVKATPLRGFQIGGYPAPVEQIERNVRDAVNDYGATLIRYQIVVPDYATSDIISDPNKYWDWWMDQVSQMIRVMEYIRWSGYHVKLVPDMHTPPKNVIERSYGPQHWVLTPEGARMWEELWIHLIRGVQAAGLEDYVAAYDLINEPAARSSRGLWAKYNRITKRLRWYTGKPFVVSHDRGDERWYKQATPIKHGPIWYTTHFYKPHNIALHGIDAHRDDAAMSKAINKFYEDPYREVRRTHRPLYKFLRKHKAQGYIGEFGVINTVPDQVRADVFRYTLENFNKRGVHWTIHALNEYPGWQPSGSSVGVIQDKINER